MRGAVKVEEESYTSLSFVTYTTDFLNLSWNWLNDPEIKKMTNTPDITREVQMKWFENLKNRSDYKVWGVKYNNEKIGVLGLKKISRTCAEYFGFIGEKKYWNKGICKFMLDHISSYARANRIGYIWLRVIKDNHRAIRAYEKYGFRVFAQTNFEQLMRLSSVLKDRNAHLHLEINETSS